MTIATLATDNVAAIAAALKAQLADELDLPPFTDEIGSVVVLTARRNGRAVQRLTVAGASADLALFDAVANLDAASRIDALEINLCHSLRRVPRDLKTSRLDNVQAGMLGVALLSGSRLEEVLAPTELIATNRSPRRAVEHLLEETQAPPAALELGLYRVGTFEAEQYLCRITPEGPELKPLFRGARPLDLRPIDGAGVRILAEGMAGWMLNQVQPDGRMVYKYWPSRGGEADSDNTIRQAMATICLGRIAARLGDAESRARADRNLDHLVATYYREENDLGLIVEDDKVKLGAVSLAALAILESPQRDRHAAALACLARTIEALRNPDGSFRTFYRPAERDDGQYFYPGETLLFWAHALKAGLPGITADAYMAAFRHYRDFFRSQPNPAFVPWHSQAHLVARDVIADPELDAFVFEMNDWLLSMQQWNTAPYADLLGRFYDPARQHYGPPHASSTGVYIEGLIDAFHLARLHGDEARANAYRRAILRGAQSLARLQFRTDEDMFYIARRERVEGGIRTETYNNEIRVDNVQHGLMGLMRVIDGLTADDYADAAKSS